MSTAAARKRAIDRFAYPLIKFLSGLHDCHNCVYPQKQITGKGRERTLCTKYSMPISRVRGWCVDRFPGFTNKEIEGFAEQYLSGKLKLVTDGAAV